MNANMQARRAEVGHFTESRGERAAREASTGTRANIDVILGNYSAAEVLQAFDDALSMLDSAIAKNNEAARAIDTIAADPCLNPALRDFLRAQPHAVIERGSDRWAELREDIRREADACDAEDAADEADES